MSKIDLFAPTPDTTFVYDPDNPTKQTEYLSWTLLKNLYNMQDAGFKLSDREIDSTDLSTFVAMYEAQDAVIDDQNDYLDNVNSMLEGKLEKMPEESFLWGLFDMLIDELAEGIVSFIISLLIASTGWGIAVLVLVLVAAYTIGYLRKAYQKGIEICDAIKAENTAMKNLQPTLDNYSLRSKILTQHDITIHNFLTQLATAETQVQTITQGNSNNNEEIVALLQQLVEKPQQIDVGYMKAIMDGPITSLSD